MNPQDKRPVFYRLLPAVQGYEWGNSDGLIHRLIEKRTGEKLEPRPIAEMWKGAHPSAPSRIVGHHFSIKPGQLYAEEMALNDAIKQDPGHFLGRLHEKGYTTLPFLFKVLDAAKPLSIQAHPDKQRAEQLHREDPAHYPDDNHKPELAISLGHFEAMAGFRPIAELHHEADRLPPLAAVCGLTRNTPTAADDISRLSAAEQLRSIYGRIMKADAAIIRQHASDLLHMLGQLRASERDNWFVRLVEFYGPEDPGIFAIYLLNYLKLEAGEAIFLGPNEPHAYLKGQILECMASSDNVVRGGLTPKFKDLPTLLSMLTYDDSPGRILLPAPEGPLPYPATYPVPVKDFRVSLLHRPEQPVAYVPLRPLSIVLLLEGRAVLRARQGDQERTEQIAEAEALFIPGDLESRGVQLFLEPEADSRIYEASTAL